MRIVSMALITALGLSVTACGSTTANRSVYSERQPVVSKANFVLDLIDLIARTERKNRQAGPSRPSRERGAHVP